MVSLKILGVQRLHYIEFLRVLISCFIFILALIAVLYSETEFKCGTILTIGEDCDVATEVLTDDFAEGETQADTVGILASGAF